MRVLITGAGGFIGQFVVQEALRRKHHVIATIRSSLPEHWREGEFEILRHDWAKGAIRLNGRDIDVVVHLAAAMQGHAERQFSDTVSGTKHLLEAVRNAHIHRIVGVSSMSVLDYTAAVPMTIIDEYTDRAAVDLRTAPYARSKLNQELLLAGFGIENGNSCVILRPGLVYDEKRLSAAHAGIIKDRVQLLVAHDGEIPTVEVRGLAAAIMNAAERRFHGTEIVHLIDDNLPSQTRYLAGLRRRGLLRRGGLVVTWRLLSGMCTSLRAVLSMMGFEERMPEVLLRHSFSARLKPFRFSNARSREVLGWAPGRTFT